MSHSESKAALISHMGGVKKVFRFDPNQPGSKRTAERARAESDSQIRAAIQSRAQQALGRNATEREMRTGLKLPDARPVGQQVREDAQTATGREGLVENERGFMQRDPGNNVYRQRIAELEGQLARTPSRLQDAIRLRIAQLQPQADHFDRELQARRDHQARLAEIADVMALSQSYLSLLGMSPDGEDQRYLELAQANHLDLIRTGDKAEFWKRHDAWQAERKTEKQAKADALKKQAEDLAALAEVVKDSASINPPADADIQPAAE